jgi:MBG domain
VTNPSGLSAVVEYNGSLTAPTAIGSYTVVATVNDTKYGGTANGTLTIAAAGPVAVPAIGPWGFIALAIGMGGCVTYRRSRRQTGM